MFSIFDFNIQWRSYVSGPQEVRNLINRPLQVFSALKLAAMGLFLFPLPLKIF
jgi:hypothetical protein